jgi:MoxR-like ATPase
LSSGSTRDALLALRSALDAAVVGQGEAKTGLLLALLAREHAYLEGPPGCAKTLLAETLARASGARVASVRFHRDLREAELLGAVRLRRTGGPRGERLSREIEPGPLLVAEVAVLDDLPRAPGEAIALVLRLLDRRVLGRRLPLETAVATGTRPGPESWADPLEPSQLDRFAIQVRMSGLLAAGDLALARELLERPADLAPLPALPAGARRRVQAKAVRTRLEAPVRRLLSAFGIRLARALGDAGAALVTDRAFLLAAGRVMRAHAFLRGAERVEPADLRALRFMVALRLPDPSRETFEALLSEVLEGRTAQPPAAALPSPAPPPSGRLGESTPGAAHRGEATAPAEEAAETLLAQAASEESAVVSRLLRAIEGRVERAQADRGEDPGGQPRRYGPLRALDDVFDCDPVDAALFVQGRHPGTPRAYRRERRNRGGALAILRDVSASMEGRLSRWAGEVVAGVVRRAARRRMRVGYVEFNHEARAFPVKGCFFHREYAELLAVASRRPAGGRTSYEAPLRLALERFRRRAGRSRHLVMLTDGVPVLGDPHVQRERAEARRLGVEVHTVFVGLGEPPRVLGEIAAETGGLAFAARPDASGRLVVRHEGRA